MNAQTKIAPSQLDRTFDRLLDTREQLAEARAMLGECIAALNGAANVIDRRCGDGAFEREVAERAKRVRWAA